VTALVSNSDFVAQNPEIVQAIVKSIQHALSLIHRSDLDVLRFARSYFHYANRAEGALNKAIKASVIPRQVSVEKPHWMSAAKASCEAENLNSTWSRTEEKRALKYYDKCIEPYGKFANEAQRIDIGKSLTTPPSRARTTFGQVIITFVVASGVTAFWGWIPASVIAMGMILLWGLSRLIQFVNIRRLRVAFLGVLWIMGLGAAVLPFIEGAGLKDKKIELLSLAVGFFIPAIWETINYAERRKE
jgi:hypothetical protein